MGVRLLVASRSDVGRVRAGNEDALLVADDPRLVAVADGMGGHQAGEVASATAVATLLEHVQHGEPIDTAISAANDAVVTQSQDDESLRGMGTTLTAGMVDGSSLRIGHVGDSRAYLLHGGELRQLTTDHSVVAELIAAGELTEEQALVDPRRSMITRALGIEASVAVDVLTVELEPGDRLLLCSDGLTTMVRDDAIAEILAAERDRERAADALVDAANAAGGADNVTVVVADVVDVDAPFEDTMETPAVAGEVVAASTAAATDDGAPTVTDDGDPDGALEALRDAVDAEVSAPRRRWWQRRKRS